MTEQNVNAVREWHHTTDPVVDFLKQITFVDRFRTIKRHKAGKPSYPGQMKPASNWLVALCLLYW
jgi:hypothetical protein